MPFNPYIHRWCQAAEHAVGPSRLRVLTERPGARAGILADLDNSILDNYDDLQRLERWAAQLGLPNAAAVLRDTFPTEARARSGHIGEALLTESVPELFLEFLVPIKRLRWVDGRNMALRGEDFIGVDRRGRRVRFLKAESKSRAVLANGVVAEARAALNNNCGRPSAHALLFIALRLDEIGEPDLSAVFLEHAVRQQIEEAQLVHLVFTFSGNDSTELLRRDLVVCAGAIPQQAVGLVVTDHQEFILAIYTRLSVSQITCH
ncbi:MAG: Hachiman antiphage defense system protein HamA [Limisphaerales bacterium]